MNGVDRMDQLRSTNITRQREKRLHMTMFTMVLDLAIHQAYSIYILSVPNETRRKHNSLTTFKQQVALSLLLPEMNKSQSAVSIFENPVQILPSEGPTSRGINETLGGISKIRERRRTILLHRMFLATYANCVDLFPKLFMDAPNVKLVSMWNALQHSITRML